MSKPHTRELVMDFELLCNVSMYAYMAHVLVLGLISIYLVTLFKITFMVCFY